MRSESEGATNAQLNMINIDFLALFGAQGHYYSSIWIGKKERNSAPNTLACRSEATQLNVQHLKSELKHVQPLNRSRSFRGRHDLPQDYPVLGHRSGPYQLPPIN